MFKITDVVKHLIIINVVIYFLVKFMFFELAGKYFFLFHPSTEEFAPIQIVTHMFMHGGEGHLFFNMLGLFFLGPMVEMRLGAKRFMILYLCSGLVAPFIHFLFFPNSILVGASGALFGVVAAFGMLFPDARLMLIFPPIPIKGKYIALFMIVAGILYDQGGNVAHLAHIAGAIAGVLIIYYWKNIKRNL
jgi:membrane associated rhomboid family serine protease